MTESPETGEERLMSNNGLKVQYNLHTPHESTGAVHHTDNMDMGFSGLTGSPHSLSVEDSGGRKTLEEGTPSLWVPLTH